jgi:hypothetical protein
VISIQKRDETYSQELNLRLTELGATYCGSTLGLPKLQTICSEFRIEHYRIDEVQILISNGCRKFSDKNSSYRDEFLINEFIDFEISRNILSLVCFYHATSRSILPSDVLEIGRIEGLPLKYTHVLISVPFFFPPNINEIEIDNVKYDLSWIMPICYKESQFISENGVEYFEKKLDQSGYGFFDIRDDLGYLN